MSVADVMAGLRYEIAGLLYERTQMTQGDADDLTDELLDLIRDSLT